MSEPPIEERGHGQGNETVPRWLLPALPGRLIYTHTEDGELVVRSREQDGEVEGLDVRMTCLSG